MRNAVIHADGIDSENLTLCGKRLDEFAVGDAILCSVGMIVTCKECLTLIVHCQRCFSGIGRRMYP